MNSTPSFKRFRGYQLAAALPVFLFLFGGANHTWAQSFTPCTTGSPNLCSPLSSRVGIGTRAPSALLTLSAPSGNSVDFSLIRGGTQQLPPSTYAPSDEGRFKFYQGDSSVNYRRYLDIVANGGSGFANSTIRFFTNSGSGTANEQIRITESGNVGIGTANPAAKLHVATPATNPANGIGSFGLITTGSYGGGIALQDGTGNFGIWADGAGTNARFGFGTNLGALSTVMSINSSGSVGIGITVPQYKLAVNGTIGAKEVIVTNTGWADYVFAPTYRLAPLTEVAEYIAQNHHLPEIPTEAEVAQRGVGVGEMQAKLLAKVEELTLHLIRADERGRHLEEQNRELQQQNQRTRQDGALIQARLDRIEKSTGLPFGDRNGGGSNR